MTEQSALAVWFYKSDTRRQAPFAPVQELDPHGKTAPQQYLDRAEKGASAGVWLQITEAWTAQRNDRQYGQKEIYLKDDATGQGSGRKRMQWALTSIVGLRCNRRYGNSNSSFSARTVSAAVYGMRSLGFWTSSWIQAMTESPAGALRLQGCSFLISAR
jgi:hypothetical protein